MSAASKACQKQVKLSAASKASKACQQIHAPHNVLYARLSLPLPLRLFLEHIGYLYHFSFFTTGQERESCCQGVKKN
jgi:hypothetical protein